jgi:UDP-4-amino-4,6-dideoxy-N-acetyl-beta-L-altrosamine transaminase
MNSLLAIEGGEPVRRTSLPYGRQSIDEADIEAVVKVLRGDWLTTGPTVKAFEGVFAGVAGARHAVAVSSGTAALHASVAALNIQAGDEVIVPALTFAATANCVVYQRGTPVFADVDADTLLIDPADVSAKITERTRAVIAVDYAGQPCDYDRLLELTQARGLALIADACHSLGATYRGRPVGSLADLNVFSLHPVKAMTTAEGGMITTHDDELAGRTRRFRNHGVTTDHFQRDQQASWYYEMVELGFNYRLSDVQCALGKSQLKKLADWILRRREIARRYDEAFAEIPEIEPLGKLSGAESAYHLYVIRLRTSALIAERAPIFAALRAEGIGVNVHYVPVNLHPFYRSQFGTGPGLCPRTEAAYEAILSLPIFPAMNNDDVDDVVTAVTKVVGRYARNARIATIAGAR